MKVIQVNIWQGKLGAQLINFLKAQKPDFVCMQEVNDLVGGSGYKFFATLDEIKEGAGFAEAVMSASYSSRYMERELSYGNAILSQYPVVSSETIFTRGQFMRNFDIEKDDGNLRNLQKVVIDINGRHLTLFNHHGHHEFGSKQGNDETVRQQKLIAGEIDKAEGPLILCGDFNLEPSSPSLKPLDKRLRNLSVENKLRSTYSQLSEVTTVCDYIFVNDQIKVQRFQMSDELVSDHQALILEFEL